MSRSICRYCHEDADYICERCLRCEKCDPEQDRQRDKADQHLNRWVWHRTSVKGVQLQALVEAGHSKGDGPKLSIKTVEPSSARSPAEERQ